MLNAEQDTQCNTGESPYPRVSSSYHPLTKEPEDCKSDINTINTISPLHTALVLVVLDRETIFTLIGDSSVIDVSGKTHLIYELFLKNKLFKRDFELQF